MTESTTKPGPEPVSADQITPKDMPTPTVPAPASTQGAQMGAPGKPEPGAAGSTPAPAPAGEVDKFGTPFDPAKHNHARHPKTGAWMPKGGRKTAPESPAGADGYPPVPPAASFIPAEEPPAAPPADAEPAAETAAEPGTADHSADAAEVVCRSVQFGLGLAFDAPEDFTAAATDHRHMVEATAAYIRAKGWHAAAGIGLFLMFAAWLLKVFQQPKPREKIRAWLHDGRAARARDVTPPDKRPAPPGANGGPAAAAATIDLPAHIPPLAKTS